MTLPLCVAGPDGAGPCRSPEACDKLRHCVAPNYRKLPNRLVSSLKDELERYVLGRIGEALAATAAQPAKLRFLTEPEVLAAYAERYSIRLQPGSSRAMQVCEQVAFAAGALAKANALQLDASPAAKDQQP